MNYYAQVFNDDGWAQHFHIGKKSMGWNFLFHGYRNSWSDYIIESSQDWIDLLSEDYVEVFDELQEKQDKQEFFDMILKQDGDMLNHVDEMRNGDIYTDNNSIWKDTAGYNFSDEDFC